MLGIVYSNGNNGVLTTPQDTAIKVATSGGTVMGQLRFGMLADIFGRKRMYGLELILIIVATLGQSLCGPSPSTGIVGLIIFWRVLMGIGIGGDYSLSSIITSEFATTKLRGSMMAAVFAMQGFGQLAGALVMLFVTLGFKESLLTARTFVMCTGICRVAVDKMWRVLVGFGALPACLALYYHLTTPETPRYTFDIARDIEKGKNDVTAYMAGKSQISPDRHSQEKALNDQAVNSSIALKIPKASFHDFLSWYSKWNREKILLGTAGSWFLLDYGKGPDVYTILFNLAAGNCILVCAGAIPGYWTTVALVDIIGCKPIQLMDFIILTILFIVWGCAYKSLSGTASLALYVLVQFFFNFGPHTTTFIVPGEYFPTRYRSTSHGISAASGKIGSIIAQAAIALLRVRGATAKNASPWQDHVMQIYSLFMFLGIFTTLLIPETRRVTLEKLSGEMDLDDQSGDKLTARCMNLDLKGGRDDPNGEVPQKTSKSSSERYVHIVRTVSPVIAATIYHVG